MYTAQELDEMYEEGLITSGEREQQNRIRELSEELAMWDEELERVTAVWNSETPYESKPVSKGYNNIREEYDVVRACRNHMAMRLHEAKGNKVYWLDDENNSEAIHG